MEKDIIGYKFKKNCKQYYSAVRAILGPGKITGLGNVSIFAEDVEAIETLTEAGVLYTWFEPVYKKRDFEAIETLTEAGVLYTWFEPVYKKRDFEVGDWITVTGNRKGGWLSHCPLSTFKIVGDKQQYYTGMFFRIKSGPWSGGLYADFRRATKEEIEGAERSVYSFGSTFVGIVENKGVFVKGVFIPKLLIRDVLEYSKNKPRIYAWEVKTGEDYPRTSNGKQVIKIGCETGTLEELELIYSAIDTPSINKKTL